MTLVKWSETSSIKKDIKYFWYLYFFVVYQLSQSFSNLGQYQNLGERSIEDEDEKYLFIDDEMLQKNPTCIYQGSMSISWLYQLSFCISIEVI